MSRRNRTVVVGTLLTLTVIILLAISLGTGSAKPPSDTAPPGTPSSPTITGEVGTIKNLIQQAVASHDDVLAFVIFDVQVEQVEVSQDGNWAVAWLTFVDPQTQQIVPTEPGLALARKVAGTWTIDLQADPGWLDSLTSTPAELLSPEQKSEWSERLQEHIQVQSTAQGPYSGYLLPWAKGNSIYLTRSISHGVGGSMHYAFDFAKPGYPSDMFAIYAARSGFVKYAVWTYPNGYYDGTCGHSNYLVLEDPSTSPTTYALYLHLAQDSIPVHLRQAGAYVARGQFLGWADDTGCSTGNHLHFMVHTNPNSYWGSSVDITFDDVSINGGRPRTPPEASNYPQYGSQGKYLYVSNNAITSDHQPPVGGLTAPADGVRVGGSKLSIQGWARDDQSGLSHYQLVARYGGVWLNVGPQFSAPLFNQTWDLCATGVPPGPVSVALNIWDRDGNLAALAGMRQIVHLGNCAPPPPACNPSANQVALYSDFNYAGGCKKFNLGDYPNASSLGGVGDDNAASIQVGSGVQASLYSQANFQGRGETFSSSDRNLADDRIGDNRVSSLRVEPRNMGPRTPIYRSPAQGAQVNPFQEVTLIWENAGGAQEYLASLTGPSGTVTTGWQTATYWQDPALAFGSLAPGSYQWKVKARNAVGESQWTASRSFTVLGSPPPVPSPETAPFTDDIEGGLGNWTADGLWHRISDSNKAHSGSYSWWYGQDASDHYATGGMNTGNLTSPPIVIPGSGYQLRFWYRYQTESQASHWDRRLVQVSVDNGPFETLLALEDDVQYFWLQSPPVDLTPYQNRTIRVRFRFETLDSESNNFQGWLVDDVAILAGSAAACPPENEPNNQTLNALNLSYGSVIDAAICPAGDVDFYRFTGKAGERIAVDIDAEAQGSSLDSHIFLYDSDGRTLLASHDDEIAYTVRDSHLGYRLTHDGTYFIKVRAWDHPSVGGNAYSYRLQLLKDNQRPSAGISSPSTGQYLPPGVIRLHATAGDSGSGVRHVEFYWHSGDWIGSDWKYLGSDQDGSDGWTRDFDTSSLADQPGLAFHARVYDWAGNWDGALVWAASIDHTPPVSALNPLDPVQGSTAFRLHWDADDNVSGPNRYNFQSKRGNGSWTNFGQSLSEPTRSSWFVADPNNVYAFRMQASDHAGNMEAYPSVEETVTYVPGCSALDSYEPDNDASSARVVTVGAPSQVHSFCQVNNAADVDWLKFSAQRGTHYRIYAAPTGPTTAPVVQLYAGNGSTLLAEARAQDFGNSVLLGWRANQTGTFYLKISHLDSRVMGDQVAYTVWIWPGYGNFFPRVSR